MINIGGISLKKCYVGKDLIKEVYVGDMLIWSSGCKLCFENPSDLTVMALSIYDKSNKKTLFATDVLDDIVFPMEFIVPEDTEVSYSFTYNDTPSYGDSGTIIVNKDTTISLPTTFLIGIELDDNYEVDDYRNVSVLIKDSSGKTVHEFFAEASDDFTSINYYPEDRSFYFEVPMGGSIEVSADAYSSDYYVSTVDEYDIQSSYDVTLSIIYDEPEEPDPDEDAYYGYLHIYTGNNEYALLYITIDGNTYYPEDFTEDNGFIVNYDESGRRYYEYEYGTTNISPCYVEFEYYGEFEGIEDAFELSPSDTEEPYVISYESYDY